DRPRRERRPRHPDQQHERHRRHAAQRRRARPGGHAGPDEALQPGARAGQARGQGRGEEGRQDRGCVRRGRCRRLLRGAVRVPDPDVRPRQPARQPDLGRADRHGAVGDRRCGAVQPRQEAGRSDQPQARDDRADPEGGRAVGQDPEQL
ncbi:MAG: hypothetical protein AVDCRST_MAG16-2189, partial [uncultured Frankineae bacterium]